MKIKKTSVATTTKNNSSKVAAKKAQPAAQVQAQSKAAPAKAEPAESRQGINAGVKTGIRVMAFQDAILRTNDELKRSYAPIAHIPGRLTDDEIAKVWREEFPNSRAVLAGRINADIVRGVRNLYNQGTGGHGTPGQKADLKPWAVVDGKRVQTAYTRVRKVAEALASPAVKGAVKASAEQADAATKAAAKKAVKVVVAAKGAKSKVAAPARRKAA